MRVFISWSGDRSRAIAEVLRRWFPSVIQAVRPYFSPDDVTKGARWNSEIAKELEASRIGLLVLTPENQDAPWLLFEAGALAKNLDRSKVCPILFGGLEPTDVKGPLVQFQAARFEPDDMKRVVKMMNSELGEGSLASDVLDSVFEMWWPKLEDGVVKELETHGPGSDDTSRSDRDMLEEVLSLARTMAREGRSRRPELGHPAFADLIVRTLALVKTLTGGPMRPETAAAIERLLAPLDYVSHRMHFRDLPNLEIQTTVMELNELIHEATKARGPTGPETPPTA